MQICLEVHLVTCSYCSNTFNIRLYQLIGETPDLLAQRRTIMTLNLTSYT
jgi:hypothetical protein